MNTKIEKCYANIKKNSFLQRLDHHLSTNKNEAKAWQIKAYKIDYKIIQKYKLNVCKYTLRR